MSFLEVIFLATVGVLAGHTVGRLLLWLLQPLWVDCTVLDEFAGPSCDTAIICGRRLRVCRGHSGIPVLI